MSRDRKKVIPSTQPMRVYVCNLRECRFEHWDGIEFYKHLKQAHDFKEKGAMMYVSTLKQQNSETWRLSKHK